MRGFARASKRQSRKSAEEARVEYEGMSKGAGDQVESGAQSDSDECFKRPALWSLGVRRSMHSRALSLHYKVDGQLGGTGVTGTGTGQVLGNGKCNSC